MRRSGAEGAGRLFVLLLRLLRHPLPQLDPLREFLQVLLLLPSLLAEGAAVVRVIARLEAPGVALRRVALLDLEARVDQRTLGVAGRVVGQQVTVVSFPGHTPRSSTPSRPDSLLFGSGVGT
jgi:hypothetical protein